MIIKLTNTEWEILEHRLGVSDCIADALYDFGLTEAENEERWTQVQDAADALYDSLGSAREIDTGALTEIDREILADCLSGSTFFADLDDAVHYGDLTRGKALAIRKAGRSIERKLNEAGIKCDVCWD